MNILYAPMKHDNVGFINTNLFCGYDMLVLSQLLEYSFVEQIFYYPHKQSMPEVHAICQSLSSKKIVSIKNLNKAKDSDVLITDLGNVSFAYSLFFQKPSVFFLPGFTGVTFEENKDKFFTLLNTFAYFCHSFASLKETLESLPLSWAKKSDSLRVFLDGELI